MGNRIYSLKTNSVFTSSAVHFCRPEVVIAPGRQSFNMQQSSRAAAWNGYWWGCVTLPLIRHRVGGADDLEEYAPQSRWTPWCDVRRRGLWGIWNSDHILDTNGADKTDDIQMDGLVYWAGWRAVMCSRVSTAIWTACEGNWELQKWCSFVRTSARQCWYPK